MTLEPEVTWLQANGWDQFQGLFHGFSTRIGNRDRAMEKLKAKNCQLYTLKQVHGDQLVTITRDSSPHEHPEADGGLSAEYGVLLGIATADCVPILLVAPQKKVAAALHAGWRGTLKGIAQQAVAVLKSEWNISPMDLYVALGPSIGSCCYEVGLEVGETIVNRWNMHNSSVWRPFGTKGFLDLRQVNLEQLKEIGIPQTHITFTGPCTFCDPRFTSYRREGAGAGRQFSVIGWLNP